MLLQTYPDHNPDSIRENVLESGYETEFCRLVHSMLQEHPLDRPTATAVLTTLERLTAHMNGEEYPADT